MHTRQTRLVLHKLHTTIRTITSYDPDGTKHQFRTSDGVSDYLSRTTTFRSALDGSGIFWNLQNRYHYTKRRNPDHPHLARYKRQRRHLLGGHTESQLAQLLRVNVHNPRLERPSANVSVHLTVLSISSHTYAETSPLPQLPRVDKDGVSSPSP